MAPQQRGSVGAEDRRMGVAYSLSGKDLGREIWYTFTVSHRIWELGRSEFKIHE